MRELQFTSLHLPSSSKYECNVYNMQLTTVGEGAATAPYKEKKTGENNIKYKQSDNTDDRILKTKYVRGIRKKE